jgi:hypothetical protein
MTGVNRVNCLFGYINADHVEAATGHTGSHAGTQLSQPNDRHISSSRHMTHPFRFCFVSWPFRDPARLKKRSPQKHLFKRSRQRVASIWLLIH